MEEERSKSITESQEEDEQVAHVEETEEEDEQVTGVEEVEEESPEEERVFTDNIVQTEQAGASPTQEEAQEEPKRPEKSLFYPENANRVTPPLSKTQGISIEFECDIPFLDRTIDIKVHENTLIADLMRHIVIDTLEETQEDDLEQFGIHFEGKPVSYFRKISDFDFTHKSRFALQKLNLKKEVDFKDKDYKPKLTKIGYTTIPPIEQLLSMTEEGLKAVRFTIQNEHARVDFKERCDLRGADLDDIFDFEPSVVRVYAGDEPKPMEGYGFNKEAFVTLLGLGVPKGEEEFEKFERKAINLVNSKDAFFIRADRETDSVTFKILSF